LEEISEIFRKFFKIGQNLKEKGMFSNENTFFIKNFLGFS